MRRIEEGAGHRHLRVQSLVLDELRALLSDDVHDPALDAVRVVAVVLSVDYRHARVHFVLEEGVTLEIRAVARALARATPRVMTRKEARARIHPEALARAMRGIVYPAHRARHLVEEAPSAYRDVGEVLRDQADLVIRRTRLEPIAVLKG